MSCEHTNYDVINIFYRKIDYWSIRSYYLFRSVFYMMGCYPKTIGQVKRSVWFSNEILSDIQSWRVSSLPWNSSGSICLKLSFITGNRLLLRELYYFSTNKSRRSLVYHQFRRNCISSTRSVASHQAAGNTAFGWWYAPTAMIYTLTRDDMPSLRLG